MPLVIHTDLDISIDAIGILNIPSDALLVEDGVYLMAEDGVYLVWQ